ncbi:MAG TPA: hypothetical protein PK048_04770 [Candidatus Absconditabacterales bacterium]|nr:hypothetical protein [Candidatus Absconditabacterales bacterium]
MHNGTLGYKTHKIINHGVYILINSIQWSIGSLYLVIKIGGTIFSKKYQKELDQILKHGE